LSFSGFLSTRSVSSCLVSEGYLGEGWLPQVVFDGLGVVAHASDGQEDLGVLVYPELELALLGQLDDLGWVRGDAPVRFAEKSVSTFGFGKRPSGPRILAKGRSRLRPS